MERFAEVVLRHRAAVALLWLVLVVGGLVSAGGLTDRLSFDFSLPGQPGYETEQQLIATYGASSDDTLVPVLTMPEGQSVAGRRADIAAVFDTVRKQLPQLRVVDLASTGNDTFVFDGGRRTFALVQGPLPTGFGPGTAVALDPVLKKAAVARGLQAGLTSYALLSAGGDSGGPSVLVETLLGALGGLLVLVFVFASFLAFVPLVIAAVSILTTFLLVLGLTVLTPVSFIVEFLISLVGLGVAIDYSLLLVSRWREERAHGHDNHTAVVIAVCTAGHAVLASGVTVAISLLALLVVPVPFLRSMGLGGLLIPLVSVAAVLTLLPALLSSIGPRLDWPRIRREGIASRGWSAWARAIVDRRGLAAGVALVVLTLLIAPVFDLRIGGSGIDSLATSGPAFTTVTQLREGGVGTGVLTPIEVLVPADRADAAVTAARGVAGVRAAVVGGTRGASAVVDVLPNTATVDNDGTALVEAVRAAVRSATGADVGITGSGAAVEDYGTAVYDNFPYVLLIIAVITFLLLARTFRSVVLPAKAVLLNLVSLAAVFGGVVFFWQQGHGSHAVFGVAPTGAITFWLPVIIFAFLFGLSMDYEVFILARMREEYDATGSTSAAVVGGLGRTGRLVTSAALILFFSFAALASAPGTDVKVLGTALGAGILIDATVIRALLVPALVSLFGEWNWWLPTRFATLLRVEPSPLTPHEGGRHRTVTPPELKPRISDDAVSRPDRSPLAEPALTSIDTLVGLDVVGADTAADTDAVDDAEPAISGSVRRVDGRALVGTPVTLIGSGGRQVAVVRTGPGGFYRLPVPIGGSYQLVASAVGYHPAAFLIMVSEHLVRQDIVLRDLDSAGSRFPRDDGAPRPTGPVGVGIGQLSLSKPWMALAATVALILGATFAFWPTSTDRATISAAAPTTQKGATHGPAVGGQDDTLAAPNAPQPVPPAPLAESTLASAGQYGPPPALVTARGNNTTALVPRIARPPEQPGAATLSSSHGSSPAATSTPVPTVQPTPMPSVEPTPVPSVQPTPVPTVQPTPVPSVEPTPGPFVEPTPVPTVQSTPVPSVEPTPGPSVEPTPVATVQPTQVPTVHDLGACLARISAQLVGRNVAGWDGELGWGRGWC